MRVLCMPSGCKVPATTPHLKELRAAYPLYGGRPDLWNPTPISLADYIDVCKYVDMYDDPVYKYLLRGGRRGVSLLKHELEEIQAFLDRGRDPYDRYGVDEGADQQVYRGAHALGLIAEHKYLKQAPGARLFRLAELVWWSPVTNDPDWDLTCLQEYVEGHPAAGIADEQLQVRPENMKSVCAWYQSPEFDEGR
jgi:hypothetical protein